jgi:hypothetical protein
VDTKLERFLAEVNQNVFLSEYTFASNLFTANSGAEYELADHVVLLPGAILAFQVKERERSADCSDTAIEGWFKRKVLDKACGQLADTAKFFETEQNLIIPNQRGHVRDLTGPEAPVIKVALYYSGTNWPLSLARTSHKRSNRAGFVHILHFSDYFEVCRILALPAEISEYFRFRESFLLENLPWKHHEARVLASFIMEDRTGNLSDDVVRRVLAEAVRDVQSFDLGNILRKYGDNIQYAEGRGSGVDYYAILDEFAHMDRVQMRAFRELFDWALEKEGGELPERPRRMLLPRGTGIVAFPVPKGEYNRRLNGLLNYTRAAKYDWKLERQIGVSVARDGTKVQIDWAFENHPWQLDPEWEHRLATDYPFRSTPEPEQDFRFRLGSVV